MAAVQNCARQRMWRSMRVLKRFTAPEIAATASVSIQHARSYIQVLKDAGYLRLMSSAKPGQPGSYSVYRLCRDSGPLYPKADPCRLVYDPNSDTYYAPQSILEKAKNALADCTA